VADVLECMLMILLCEQRRH